MTRDTRSQARLVVAVVFQVLVPLVAVAVGHLLRAPTRVVVLDTLVLGVIGAIVAVSAYRSVFRFQGEPSGSQYLVLLLSPILIGGIAWVGLSLGYTALTAMAAVLVLLGACAYFFLGKGPKGYGGYVPDPPGCNAAASARREMVRLTQEAIELLVEDLRNRGEPLPPPSSTIELVLVAVA